MNFIKQNLHRILRVLVNQVGVMIFALIITLTAGAMAEEQQAAMTLVASIFSIVFYLFLVFYCMREEGSRDSVRIEGGRLAYDPIYGLKVGAIAILPNYIFVLLMLIGLLIGIETGGAGVWSIGYFVTSLIQSMYNGLLKSIFSAAAFTTSFTAATVAYAITPLFAPLAAFGGYIYGVKHPTADKKRR